MIYLWYKLHFTCWTLLIISQFLFHPDLFDVVIKQRFDMLLKSKDLLMEQPFSIDSHEVFIILKLDQLAICVFLLGISINLLLLQI